MLGERGGGWSLVVAGNWVEWFVIVPSLVDGYGEKRSWRVGRVGDCGGMKVLLGF